VKLWKSPIFWEITALVVLVVGAVFFKHHHSRYTIPQNGMFPDLPAQSSFWVTKHPYRTIADVRRGDVIVFRLQKDGAPVDYIWRVIALPGERIAIREDAVTIDNHPLPRTPLPDEGDFHIFEETAGGSIYRIALPPRLTTAGDMAETTVPPGHVFVLGDNRHQAADSRVMGPVPFSAIVARVGLR
jgi:signal peptidase I